MIPVGDARNDQLLEIVEDALERLPVFRSRVRKLGCDLARPDGGQDGISLRMLEVGLNPLADPHKVFFKPGQLFHNMGVGAGDTEARHAIELGTEQSKYEIPHVSEHRRHR